MAQDPGTEGPGEAKEDNPGVGSNGNEITLLEGEDRNKFTEELAATAFIYQIKGRPAFAYGDIYLNSGQKIIADSRALLWMDGDITVGTNMEGGCFASYMRQCSGEPCCFNNYIGTGQNQKLSVGFQLPGDLMAFGVTKKDGWVFTYDAFVAGTDNLQVSSRFSGCCACSVADESIFLTTVTINNSMNNNVGVVLAGGYGMIERHEIKEGETLLVSRGLFFAAKKDVEFNVGLIGQECGGLCNLCCANGGIVYKFNGPSVIYTQSKNPIQLLKDFGIPGGKERDGAGAVIVGGGKCLCCILKGAGEASSNAG